VGAPVNIPLSTWISAGLVFVAVAFGAIAVALVFEFLGERKRQKNLVGQLQKFEKGLMQVSTESGGLLRRAVRESQFMQDLTATVPTLGDLQLTIQQAGSTMTVGSFLMLIVGMGVGGGLATLLLSGRVLVAIPVAFLFAWLPYLWIRRRRKRRLYAFESELPEAIDLLGRAIRAGHPLSSGMKMVADESGEPIAGEFRRTFEENRFGVPFDDAIQEMSDRVDIVDVRILVTAILIQREVGGNLAEVLDNLASVIRARFTIRRQLRVFTAQGRMSGYVLALLPIVVGTIIYLMNPEYGSRMFTHPMGRLMLGIAFVMQIIGFLWIRKIINIDI
jgi:tight adherence protein B